MKEKTILQRIDELLPNMTKSQLRIAHELKQNPNLLLFCSIEQASEQLGVSTATIVRFANLFGLRGYTELQNQFRSHYQLLTEPEQRLNTNLADTAKKQNLYAATYAKQMKILEELYTPNLENKLSQATELLCNAHHIYTVGPRATYAVAYYLGHHLNRIFKNCDILETNERLADMLVRIQPDDVVLLANHPRYVKNMHTIAQITKKAGASLIVITDSLMSPFVKYGDVCFIAPTESNDFHNSLLPSMMIAELLITSMMLHDKQKTQESLKNLNPYLKELDVFM